MNIKCECQHSSLLNKPIDFIAATRIHTIYVEIVCRLWVPLHILIFRLCCVSSVSLLDSPIISSFHIEANKYTYIYVELYTYSNGDASPWNLYIITWIHINFNENSLLFTLGHEPLFRFIWNADTLFAYIYLKWVMTEWCLPKIVRRHAWYCLLVIILIPH